MKQQEITNLSQEDLNNQIKSLTEKLTKTKLNHKILPSENPSQIRSMRRTIAQLKTELTKRSKQA